MVRILQVLPTLNVCGGVENYLMNYYSNIDRKNIRFDFAVHDISDNYFKDIIEQNGDKIYKLPKFSFKNLKEIKSQIKKIFETEQYDIIHCHQANAAYFYFKIAKKCGIRHRILHSHQSRAADKLSHALRNKPLLFLGKKYSTDFFACSELAGKYLFGKNFKVIVNAIQTEKFEFSEKKRSKIRKIYSIPENAYVVGHIGRMCPQKNQSFLLDIFNEIHSRNDKARLLLIGDGEDRKTLEQKVAKLDLIDAVIFTGSLTNTNEFYSAMDVFVLPSLYEGLPVVGIEAQSSGLNIVTSTNVTEELNLFGSVKFLSLGKTPEYWAYKILNLKSLTDRNEAVYKVKKNGYEISIAVNNLEELYIEMIK